MNQQEYQYIVVGKGLIGAAAARHLSTQSQGVALIGPDEPVNRTTHSGVFGSHYDEGRITRILDPDRIWAIFAQRSIERYREIEQQSGIRFYYEVGHLAVGPEPHKPDDYTAQVQAVGTELGVEYTVYDEDALAKRFPYLRFEPGSVGMYQPHKGGHVSPRAQVRAQTIAAAKQGTTFIPETVHTVRQVNGLVEVKTDEGHTYKAERVLLATGGFSNTKELLPKRLDMIVYARTIVLMEVDEAEVARLQDMPSLIYKPRDPNNRCYILPPIRYPDGKYYIKLGGGPHDHPLHTLQELQEWFQSKGSEKTEQHLLDILYAVIRDLRPLSIHTDTCVTTHTPTERPYVDKLEGGQIGIVVGGNGSAAKSADEIGRMGAEMMRHDRWAYDLAHDLFRARFVEK